MDNRLLILIIIVIAIIILLTKMLSYLCDASLLNEELLMMTHIVKWSVNS